MKIAELNETLKAMATEYWTAAQAERDAFFTGIDARVSAGEHPWAMPQWRGSSFQMIQKLRKLRGEALVLFLSLDPGEYTAATAAEWDYGCPAPRITLRHIAGIDGLDQKVANLLLGDGGVSNSDNGRSPVLPIPSHWEVVGESPERGVLPYGGMPGNKHGETRENEVTVVVK